jgi:hypothetical protein
MIDATKQDRMNTSMSFRNLCCTLPLLAGVVLQAFVNFAVETKSSCLVITHGGQLVATYVFRDDKVLRPHFRQVHAPGGIQVTRNHPPVAGQDATDHDTMHPGLWLAFGDINGHDFWRNKAVIKHERFTEPPAVRDGALTFAAENFFQTTNGQPVCRQTSRITLAVRPCGYLLIWDATFKSSERDFVFGDQEEMGLGVRAATAITQKNGGVIRNSAGEQGAKATWGKAADWSDYSGVIGGRRVGILLMPDPRNFRPSWFHNRDYGLMVANPFGRNAFTKGEKSAVVVKKGEPFRLRFGALMHAALPGQDVDLSAESEHFKRTLLP